MCGRSRPAIDSIRGAEWRGGANSFATFIFFSAAARHTNFPSIIPCPQLSAFPHIGLSLSYQNWLPPFCQLYPPFRPTNRVCPSSRSRHWRQRPIPILSLLFPFNSTVSLEVAAHSIPFCVHRHGLFDCGSGRHPEIKRCDPINRGNIIHLHRMSDC